ncbi:hypothetical protein G6F57_011694 [Rhizopus arrhizus]|uniref:Acyl-protein thioesterase 1 n=1 Tax=Rhizopus oryzae TaxID=64495 RepID=A0A9P7BVM0_RHIOR|nr:hypothetical protein G6F22_008075 [Rhizopus arrhizus]KAG1412436.1 hypothetical protein G6F58_008015 [Rhizopus delemar]KAG0795236.1 hypothetical protein G6F21_002250 [Rhizopus arrhizus]KAG0817408.1 hypothetical protein G6F20_002417 [Rhizopus arrhizus]KAG0825124.1 hypothetical protein G6F18_010546 [Rhizopus arrhizus]
MSLSPLIVAAQTAHTATVIWLHGLNNSSAGFAYLPEELGDHFPYVKWVLPDAPFRDMTFAGGFPMRAWFDVGTKDEDRKGMLESVETVNSLVRNETKHGIDSDRVVVGGFSQGCVISLLSGLRLEHKLAGIVGYSGWVALKNETEKAASEANKNTPFLIAHGTEDPVVQYKLAKESVKELRALNYTVTFKTYQGLKHEVSSDEVKLLAQFLKKVIPP